MARKKPEPKPLFPLKHEFYESLDAYCQAVLMLVSAARMAVEHGGLNEPLKKALTEAVAALEKRTAEEY